SSVQSGTRDARWICSQSGRPSAASTSRNERCVPTRVGPSPGWPAGSERCPRRAARHGRPDSAPPEGASRLRRELAADSPSPRFAATLYEAEGGALAREPMTYVVTSDCQG